jgi:uncharacterized membrane protein (DUF2068 family)
VAIRYELIGCGLHGHYVVGDRAGRIAPEDRVVVREDPEGFRWCRCLRCDAWIPVDPSADGPEDEPLDRSQIEVPLRGRPLRDRYVLRLIALDRCVHVLALTAIAVAIFAFAAHRTLLKHDYTRILADLQGGLGGPVNDTHSGIVSELNKLFALTTTRLYETGAAVSVYTALLAVEAVGLWRAKRWAEYLTFIETAVLVPFEIYELTKTISYLKILTLVINLAVVVYLLVRHRLFGVRGGGSAERAEHERDSGWAAIERTNFPIPATMIDQFEAR